MKSLIARTCRRPLISGALGLLVVVVALCAGEGFGPAGPATALAQQAVESGPTTAPADAAAPAWEQPATDRPTPDSAGDDSSEEGAEETVAGAPPALSGLFPIGREFLGVKIPSYSGDVLNSVVTSRTMKRVDEEHLEMNDLVITLFGSSQEEGDTYIVTDKGVYDLKSETLTSRSKAYIHREGEFDMVGDRMIFDGKTQEGRLVGNVIMKIVNVGENFSKP